MHFSSIKTIAFSLVLAFLFQYGSSYSQNPEWLNYYNGKNVTAVANDGIFVWLGTDIGNLVKLNKATGAMTFFSKSNSGLPGSRINCLVKDPAGSLWIGTNRGLVKYNGNAWRVYNQANSPIPDDTVKSIALSLNGNLKWFITPHSLVSLLDSTAWTEYNIGNSGLHSANLFAVNVDASNNVWVGGDVGLDKRDINNNWTWYTPQNSDLPDMIVKSISFLQPDRIAVGTERGGLGIMQSETWVVLDISNSILTTNDILHLTNDNADNLYIGTAQGLFKLAGNTLTVYTSSNSQLPDNNIRAIIGDDAPSCWIGTIGGLSRLVGTSVTNYNPSNLMMDNNNIRFSAMDMYGEKWFVSDGMGVTSWDGTNWTSYKQGTSGLPSNNVFYIGVDPMNNKWFCTDSGLSKFNGTTWTTYRRSSTGLPSDTVTVVAFEGNNIWVGTNGFGLAKFNGTAWTRYNTSNSAIPGNVIKALAIDAFGNKWVGTDNYGVGKFDGTDWTIYNTLNSQLPSNNIRQILIDNSGKKWFATAGGAANLNVNTWTVYNTGNSGIGSNDVLALGVESNGTRWFAVNNYGLVKYDGTAWTLYAEPGSPLTTNNVKHFYIDPSGNKWISTFGGGLFVFRTGGILPTVHTKYISGPFCVDQSFDLFYNVFASPSFVVFGAANIFTAQLSDVNGMFGTPINIGTNTSQVSDTIPSRLPKTLVYSTKYRVRVIASSPALVNSDNGTNLTIYELPAPVITGNNNVCVGGNETYKTTAVPGISFDWFITGGTISGRMNDSTVAVIWGGKGTGYLKLIQTTAAGCMDSVTLTVNITSRPPKNINGDTNVCANRYDVYYTVEDSTLTNDWFATGGQVISKPANNTVKVLWGAAGTGKLKLVQTTRSGCRDSMTINIRKFVSPTTNFTGPDTAKHSSVRSYSTPPPTPGITNKWSVVGGVINGNSTQNTVSVTWGKGPSGKVKLVQRTAAGCVDSLEKSIFIYEPIAVNGARFVCENLFEDYYVATNLEAECLWTVTGGKIEAGNNKKMLSVTWGPAGKGSVRLIQTYVLTGYKDTLNIPIQINPKPGKPSITEKDGTLTSSIDLGNKWYYNGVLIRDAFGKTHYTEEKSGVYTVQVSDSVPCLGDMSDPFNFVSAVEELGSGNSGIKLYPNPTDGILNFSFIGTFDKVYVSLVDILGKELVSSTFTGIDNSARDMDISNFADGVYIVIIRTGNQQYQQRIVLRH